MSATSPFAPFVPPFRYNETEVIDANDNPVIEVRAFGFFMRGGLTHRDAIAKESEVGHWLAAKMNEECKCPT